MSGPTRTKKGTHFIANIIVTKVEKFEDTEYNKLPQSHRNTSHVARIVVADDSIPGLMGKVAAHIALVEDADGDINDARD